MGDLTGKTLGKYRLLERLGRGGMAEVYRAFQPNLEREVAVKVMHGYLAEDADFIGRFKREARAVATLRHPHIIQVYDFDVEDDVHYMVMEYIAGETLKARLERLHAAGKRMSLAEVDAVLRPLCDALTYAHSQGRVHRDIKPANVMFEGQRLVLTDFGIATIVGGTCYTAPGSMVGTPAYMSPEQCRGEPGDARSDIYSLGIVLYEMVAGQVPFDADTPLAIVLKQLNDPLPLPSRVLPGLPPAVEQVILKALAKIPGDRYQTANALADAFGAAVQEGAPTAEGAPVAAAVATPVVAAAVPAVVPGGVAEQPEAGLIGGTAQPVEAVAPPTPGVVGRAGTPSADEPAPAAEQVGAAVAGGPTPAVRARAPRRPWPGWAWGSVVAVSVLVVATLALFVWPGLLVGLAGRGTTVLPSSPVAGTAVVPTSAPTAVPGEAGSYYEAGLAAMEAGDYTRAISECTSAIAVDPGLADAYFLRGSAYRDNGQRAEAISDMTQVIALQPDRAEAYYERAKITMDQELPDSSAALADLSKAIELQPDSAVYYTTRAALYYWYMSDIAGALSDLNQALALDPSQMDALRMRGEILFYYQEDYAQAEVDLSRAVEQSPDDVYSWSLLALVHYFGGDYRQAISDFDQALTYAPDDAEFHYGRGMVYARNGDAEAALADLDRALELDPLHGAAHYGRGKLYVEAGRYDEAVADFTAVISNTDAYYAWPFFQDEDSPYLDRAQAYQALGQTDAALADLNTLIGDKPDWYLPYYYRGLLFRDVGQAAAALADFQRLYELAPDDEWRDRAQEEISALSP